jgi:hypothetical protein
MANPIKAAFTRIRLGAKDRKVAFTLTLEEFADWCKETNYLELLGSKKGCMQIDRRDHRLGYEKDNIQILELVENAKKGAWERDHKGEVYPF